MSSRVRKTPLFKKSLHDVIRGIRACKDPEAVDTYIRDAISECRQEVQLQDMDIKSMAILKLSYLQMLGYDMSWASFNVLEVMSSQKFQQKRIGYLAAMQSFGADTDVLMLTTNMLKKDLASPNHLDVAIAIGAIANIVSPSLARDLAEDLLKMMNHSRPYVRKKAVLVMYKIFLQYPQALRASFPRLREKLQDPEISVKSATVNVVCELAKKHPKNYLALAPQLYDILTTSSNNWMLIKIIKLFASLVPCDKRLKGKLLPPITNLIQTTTAMSLLYECVNCIVSSGMLAKEDDELATMCVSKLRIFFEETDQNLKFVGLLAYNKIVLTHPLLVAQNADVVMDCMDDPDLSIRERAVELVVYLVNTDTLFEVVKRLMLQLIPQSRDQILPETYRIEVVRRILDMCSKNTYENVTNFEWYVAVLVDLVKITEGIKVLGPEIGAELQNVAVRVRSVRDYAVSASVRLLNDRGLIRKSPGVLKYAAWVVGEYSSYIEDCPSVLASLLALEPQGQPSEVEAVYIQALPKVYSMYAGSDVIPWTSSRTEEISLLTESIVSYLEKFSSSMDIEVQERSVEFLELFRLIVLAIKERPDDDSDLSPPLLISQAMRQMFSQWELNPVSAIAQQRIPIPDGLDLDEEFNNPIYYSESEDEEEVLLRQQILKQQEINASKSVNSAQPNIVTRRKGKKGSKKAAVVLTPDESLDSEEEAEMEKRRAERRRRQAEDPYYILESDKVASKTRRRKAQSSSDEESSSDDDPIKDEELDIDSIPIMKLEITSIATPADSKKKKKKRVQPASVEIVKEETYGDGEEVAQMAHTEVRRTRTTGKTNNLLRVNAKGLEELDLNTPDDEDEAGRLEVERFRAEIQAARKKAEEAAAAEDQNKSPIVVKKKKKTAKVVTKVKKSSKKKKAIIADEEEEQEEEEIVTVKPKKAKSKKIKPTESESKPENVEESDAKDVEKVGTEEEKVDVLVAEPITELVTEGQSTEE
ncbi:adaptin N terminal region-domain-containing protein [Lipomyces oligophaga]|uniref:adaptin N terminal region-domain-containing protein n=1 Tax=Lipomyces oligophaga TaxID=45792 RepID=UPI0034CDF3E9